MISIRWYIYLYGVSLVLTLLFHEVEFLSYVKFTQVECFHNSKYIEAMNCSLKSMNRYNGKLYFYFKTARPLKTIYAQIKAFRKTNGGYNQLVISVIENFCALMSGSFMVLLGELRDKIKQISNINHACPYHGEYFVNGLYLERKSQPSDFLHGEYKSNFTFLNKPGGQAYGTLISHVFVGDELQNSQGGSRRNRKPKSFTENKHWSDLSNEK